MRHRISELAQVLDDVAFAPQKLAQAFENGATGFDAADAAATACARCEQARCACMMPWQTRTVDIVPASGFTLCETWGVQRHSHAIDSDAIDDDAI